MPTKKNIESPRKLYEYFERYKKHCKANPKKQYVFIPSMKKQMPIDKEVPLTWVGFEVWLNKNKIIAKLDDYEANSKNRYSEYSAIIRTIKKEIREDKLTGAAAGIYQHNIIARDLGLVDKSESKVTKIELKGIENMSIDEFNDKENELLYNIGVKQLNSADISKN